ncbi:MAG: thiamine pyrophosphate-dependent enzyme [Flavobacteriales bacterium]
MSETVKKSEKHKVNEQTLRKAWQLMCTAREMAKVYEENKEVTSKYVHATSSGHEAVQLALGLQLQSFDYVAPYYRDDSILLGIGMRPYELMLQLLAKRDDPFSGGRTYYSHPSLRRENMPFIPHQSSATGMQTIPTTGVAMGVQYMEKQGLSEYSNNKEKPVVVCSLGDAAITEGEISEAFQMAVLKQLPILYFVQDNEWDISANAEETRAQDATEFAQGFKGLETRTIKGNDFEESYETIKEVMGIIRKERRPFLIHAKVPLLSHHTSGVRMEWYRDDLEVHKKRDPIPIMKDILLKNGIDEKDIDQTEKEAKEEVKDQFEDAMNAEDPIPEDIHAYNLAPTSIIEEKGERSPKGKDKAVMVDCALLAVKELMEDYPESLLYGQDVGGRLGGVFREAATLADKFGKERVFNTPIQEAFIIGSTVGMSVAGAFPIVEVQFADYIWPGLNQLFTELSRAYYLSNGKWEVNSVIRVPTGAYGSGGPYHSSSVESVVTNIKGIKVVYPSTGADLKGLIKAAFYDPNPVVIFEHKGLYWSKIKGTEEAKTVVPDRDYVLPIGKGRIALECEKNEEEPTIAVITYGRGVYWAANAAKNDHKGKVEVVDLRSLSPFDEKLVYETVRKHNRCLVVTEEPVNNSYAQSLAGQIQRKCFEDLDAPVEVIGSENVPGIPLNSTLEHATLPNEEKVSEKIGEMLKY